MKDIIAKLIESINATQSDIPNKYYLYLKKDEKDIDYQPAINKLLSIISILAQTNKIVVTVCEWGSYEVRVWANIPELRHSKFMFVRPSAGSGGCIIDTASIKYSHRDVQRLKEVLEKNKFKKIGFIGNTSATTEVYQN